MTEDEIDSESRMGINDPDDLKAVYKKSFFKLPLPDQEF